MYEDTFETNNQGKLHQGRIRTFQDSTNQLLIVLLVIVITMSVFPQGLFLFETDNSTRRVITFCIQIAVAFVIYLLDLFAITRAFFGNIFLLLFVIWSLYSLLWTGEHLINGIGQICLIISACIAGIAIARSMNNSRQLYIFIFSTGLLVFASLISIAVLPFQSQILVLRPGGGMMTMLVGVFSWNSDFSFTAGIGAVFAFSLLISKFNIQLCLIFGLLAFAVFAANSATGTIAFIFTLAFISITRLMRWKAIPLFLLCALSVVVLFVYSKDISQTIFSSVNRSSDLTGRSYIWQVAWETFLKSPLLGSGIGNREAASETLHSVGHAHNGYLDILIQLGFPGLVFIILLAVIGIKNGWNTRRYEVLGGVVFVLVFCLANSLFTGGHLALIILIWAAASKNTRQGMQIGQT